MKFAAQVKNIKREYRMGTEIVHALKGVSVDVPIGDFVSIMGASGSGKSTLLNILGCLDSPTSGEYILGEDDVSKMNDDQLSYMRASRMGIIFQSFHLIPQLSVLENIELPLGYRGNITSEDHDRAVMLAEKVKLGDRLDHRPSQLSGGQQQRAAIARSLINNPKFLLADEPTGNLDIATTNEILELLTELNEEGKTIVMVTHEDEVAEYTKRTIRLRDGLIQSDEIL